MQYSWAKSFVDFMGYIVPMVDGLEDVRLYGPESIKLKERLARELLNSKHKKNPQPTPNLM
jgi:hypothetical protein